MGWSAVGLIWELGGGGWVDRWGLWWVDRNSVVVDGLISGGFAGFDRFCLLGRSVWSIAFVRFDRLIGCWVWWVWFYFSHGFDLYGFGFTVLITCWLMCLLGFKNMNSHDLGLIGEEHEERWRTQRTVHAHTQLSLKRCAQAYFILCFNWEELRVYFYAL